MEEPREVDGINGVDGTKMKSSLPEKETVPGVLHRILAMIFFPDPGTAAASSSAFQRIKASFSENGPRLKDATRNTSRKILIWTRRGSPLRALLVISVGTIALLTSTGLLVSMLFFLAATFNAIVISLLISLAAAGGFLALFLACVTAVYIGALSVAAVVISTMTVSAIVAVIIATGWIGFLWTVWLVAKKSVGAAKHSLSLTGSAISSLSSARVVQRHHEPDRKLD